MMMSGSRLVINILTKNDAPNHWVTRPSVDSRKKLRFLARKFLRLAYKVNQGYDQCWIDLQGKILFFSFPLV